MSRMQRALGFSSFALLFALWPKKQRNRRMSEWGEEVTIDTIDSATGGRPNIWIEVPAKYGGTQEKVEEMLWAKKCKCGQHVMAKIYVLETCICIECTYLKGFVFQKKPKDMSAFKALICISCLFISCPLS